MLETEVYSPDFDQWTVVKPISMGQSEAGACVVCFTKISKFSIDSTRLAKFVESKTVLCFRAVNTKLLTSLQTVVINFLIN